MSDALKLYWWKDIPNFGDAISRDIVAHLSGRRVEWASPEDADIFSVGSIMTRVRAAYAVQRDRRPWVWGSGCIKAMRRDFLPNVRIAALRGPLTAEWLGVRDVPIGDPALLLPEVLGADVKRSEKIGIVPHFRHYKRAEDAASRLGSEVDLIDVRKDHLDVVRQIAGCRLVFSSSLHGLIVADAFGIPSVWLNPVGNHASPNFKFYDYAVSVGRGLPRPIEIEDIGGALRSAENQRVSYGDQIQAVTEELKASFPDELRADKPLEVVSA